MSFTYDLTSEPWIPCLMGAGDMRDLSLTEVLVEAPQVREVLDSSPLVTASLHRLLLAIIHRLYGPRDDEVWEEMWLAGRFEEGLIRDYFKQWRHRFDLFDEERPFYQTPGMPEKMSGAPSLLAQDMAAGNNDTLFDHSADSSPAVVSASKAARLLLARQAFSLGGLITAEGGRASAKAAPLAPAAITLLQGDNLFRTLLLNLMRYDPGAGDPLPCSDDCPTWEQNATATDEERAPKGYLDYLTWQSRRLFLQPESDSGGGIVVPKVILAQGSYFPSNYFPWDTMTPHGVKEKALVGQDPRPPVRFLAWRALWRDSLALMQTHSEVAGETLGSRPETLSHLAVLVENGIVSRREVCGVSVLGLCSKQAKVHFWRHERMSLPLAYLVDDALVGILRTALALAEDVARALGRAVRSLADAVLSGGEGRRTDQDAVAQLADSLEQPAGYWSSLEPAFPALLQALPEADEVGREAALGDWAGLVEREVWSAWHDALAGLPDNGRCLRAIVTAERGLLRSLGLLLKPYKEVKDDEAQSA
ncbi:MAG TPA: type I-E CRISPR-associated protein Cse1/CasA [Armatimonadota bacterium]|jgi:CRISPR system Cascade subunit CasA